MFDKGVDVNSRKGARGIILVINGIIPLRSEKVIRALKDFLVLGYTGKKYAKSMTCLMVICHWR